MTALTRHKGAGGASAPRQASGCSRPSSEGVAFTRGSWFLAEARAAREAERKVERAERLRALKERRQRDRKAHYAPRASGYGPPAERGPAADVAPQHPFKRAIEALFPRLAPDRRFGFRLDGRPIAPRDAIRAANEALAKLRLPLIAYPGVRVDQDSLKQPPQAPGGAIRPLGSPSGRRPLAGERSSLSTCAFTQADHSPVAGDSHPAGGGDLAGGGV
jgi:hypothetical protein